MGGGAGAIWEAGGSSVGKGMMRIFEFQLSAIGFRLSAMSTSVEELNRKEE